MPMPCLNQGGVPLAIVLGMRANVPAPKISGELTTLIRKTVDAEKPVTLVLLDGAPKVVFDETPEIEAGNEVARKQAVERHVARIRQVLVSAKAHRPEADVLKGLSQAARLAGRGGNIAVLDSGLATEGQIDFRQVGMLNADPAEVVSFLKDGEVLPDLVQRHVLFQGLGNTVEPQPELGEKYIKRLSAMWTTIADKAGAACSAVVNPPTSRGSIPGVPSVSVVSPPTAAPIEPCGERALTDAENVGFLRGNAEFRDPEGATETLKRVAASLGATADPIELVGTTSSEGGDAVNIQLSEARAEKVRSVLIQLGIPAKRITARGVGTRWHDHVDDTTRDGILIPAAAEKNRKVVLRLPECP